MRPPDDRRAYVEPSRSPVSASSSSDDAARLVAALLRDRQAAGGIVGIDGGTGAGKTTLAHRIADLLNGAVVVHTDEFIRCRSQRRESGAGSDELGWDMDWRRVRDEVLTPVRAGCATAYRGLVWTADVLGPLREIPQHATLIVEGVYALRPALRDFYDVQVWVIGPPTARHGVSFARDGEESRAPLMRWWVPEEDRYLERSGDAVAQADVRVVWQTRAG